MFMLELLTAERCAGCSTTPFEGMRCRSASVLTTILFTDSTNGKQTFVCLGVDEVKSVSHVPLSHPFVERLIGTIRRECIDRMLFWSALDLEQKLSNFGDFYNMHRAHASLDGRTLVQQPKDIETLSRHGWEEHCGGLYQTPIAA